MRGLATSNAKKAPGSCFSFDVEHTLERPSRTCSSQHTKARKCPCVFTCEVFGQVWVVHETVTGEFDTLQSDRHVDVIKPFLIKETDVNVGDFKRWLVHEHSSKKTASHVGTQHTSTSSLYITLCHMTPAKPSHIFWTRSKIQVYWGRISLTLSQIN